MVRSMSRGSRRGLFCAPLAVALAIALVAPAGAAGPAEEDTVSVTIAVGAYEITDTPKGHTITVEDFGYLLVPGRPQLPSKIFAVAIPPGAEVVGVGFDAGEGIVLPGCYQVAPVGLPRVIGLEDPAVYEREKQAYAANYNAAYGSDAPYPQQVAELVGKAGYRKYNLVDVRVTPFAYRPASGQLTYYPEVTIHVDYRLPQERVGPIVDNLLRTERTAQDIIVNYEQARRWSGTAGPGGRGLHDFVIITLDTLTSAVVPLADWESYKGRTVEVVTTSWINSNYTGYDLAEKIRNFLRDKYPSGEWGIEDVLLVGHYDDVPMRRCWQDAGYGKPETDLYYAELSLPDNQSWDADGDHLWGEDTDPIDFYSEVNVGRIPWSDPATVSSICQKSAAYEQNEDPSFKKNILLLGAFFWPDTDNAVLMEAKVDQPWMSDWTMTRMYEQGYSSYSMDYNLKNSNVVSVWSAGKFAFVDWAGHGSPTSSHIYYSTGEAFIASGNCAQLNDDYPAIIFADACSNSDTDYLNIGQAMLKQGGVGFLGATKVAYGMPGWNSPNDGSSQSLDYFFTTAVTSGDYTQGAGHQWALREMYTRGLWYFVKYEMFEWGALWGNPDLAMEAPALLSILFPDGLPEYVTPGEETAITVQIKETGDAYVPGSGTLYYCYDGGDFLTTPLVSISGDLYEATLPVADCDDVPEYYFSAEGVLTGVIYSPYDAPVSTYSAAVGEVATLFVDDFEIDHGWTVENVDLQDGQWERGVPIGGGDRGDPPNDYDGSGKCYLTDNEDGNSDVDGGPTRLVSPVIDLSGGGDYTIAYARWFYNDDHDQDRLDVEISNDDGANWTLVESVPHSSGWIVYSFHVADFVTPTSHVRVRFSATDNPNDSVTEAGIDAFEVSEFVCEDCIGDLDGDNDIDLADLSILLSHYGMSSGAEYEDGDLDGDGDVDLSDLGALLTVYGTEC